MINFLNFVNDNDYNAAFFQSRVNRVLTHIVK